MVQYNLFTDESRLEHDKSNFFHTTAVQRAIHVVEA